MTAETDVAALVVGIVGLVVLVAALVLIALDAAYAFRRYRQIRRDRPVLHTRPPAEVYRRWIEDAEE